MKGERGNLVLASAYCYQKATKGQPGLMSPYDATNLHIFSVEVVGI